MVVVDFLLFIFLVYYVSTLLGYLSHKMFHEKWAGFAAKSHMVHHLVRYPTDDLVSEKYRHAGKNTTILLFIPIILAALGLTGALAWLGLISVTYAIVGMVEIVLISIAHNALHDAFHVRETFLQKIPGFKRMKELHFEHHFQMDKNFGIFDFTWDEIFKTFSEAFKEAKR